MTVFVPEGMTHTEFVLGEAERAFLQGREKDGVVNLAHALYVVARDGMDPGEARVWFRRVTAAAGVWE